MDKIAQGVPIGETFFGGGHKLTTLTGIGDLVTIILSNALVIAGIIMLFLLVFGGVSMVIGAGRDNPEQAAKGKQAATAAVIGFIIIFAAYWIIQIVEYFTGIKILQT